MIATILILFFAMIAGLSKAISDTLQHHHNISVFSNASLESFFGADSDLRKYKYNNVIVRELMKTVFVSLTDGWHLFNMIGNLSSISSWYISLIYSLEIQYFITVHLEFLEIQIPVLFLIVLIWYIIRTISFHIFYTYVLVRKVGI